MRDLYQIFELPPTRSPAVEFVVFIHEDNLVAERELLGRQLLGAAQPSGNHVLNAPREE